MGKQKFMYESLKVAFCIPVYYTYVRTYSVVYVLLLHEKTADFGRNVTVPR